MESACNEFGLFSFGIGDTDPVISIGMNKQKVRKDIGIILGENLSKEAKKSMKLRYLKRILKFLKKNIKSIWRV